MGDLRSAVERSLQRTKGPQCGVGILRSTLTPEQASEMDSILATRHYTAGSIATALEETYKQSIRPFSVQRHRRGDCICETP